MSNNNSKPVTFGEFKKVIADALVVDEEMLQPETSFIGDLFVDSLRLVEMALRIEQLGVKIPSTAYWDIQTVGQAYDAYVEYTNHKE